MGKMNYFLTANTIDIYYEGSQYHVENKEDSKEDFLKLFNLLSSGGYDIDQVLETAKYLQELQNRIKSYLTESGNIIEIKNGLIYYGDTILKSDIIDRILEFEERGVDPSAFVNFIDKVMQNPSTQSVNELYLFLQHNKLPITRDGNFLAYKRIKENWMDIHSGSISNNPKDSIPRMLREEVNPNRNETCSYGYHVCGYDYLEQFGSAHRKTDRVVLVEVDPRAVVSVPIDYRNAKMRITYYSVLEEIPNWKSVKIRDYFVEDVDRYESWEDYKNSQEETVDEINSELEENYEKWLEEEEYLTSSYVYEDEEEEEEEEEDDDEFLKIYYKVSGKIYEGYLIDWIDRNEDAKDKWQTIKQSHLIRDFVDDFGCQSVIKDRFSINRRALVIVTRIDSERIDPYKVCVPSEATLKKFNPSIFS